jgi:hypothetical protein
MAKRDNLKQYVLYLSREYDTRLIDHIDGFTAARRANQEMRRLLYAGLDGVSRMNGNSHVMPHPFPIDFSEGMGIDQEPTQPIDARSKLKRTFG